MESVSPPSKQANCLFGEELALASQGNVPERGQEKVFPCFSVNFSLIWLKSTTPMAYSEAYVVNIGGGGEYPSEE